MVVTLNPPSYTCSVCSLKFEDEGLIRPHSNTPLGNFCPPKGLVYVHVEQEEIFYVVRGNGGVMQSGNHLHDQYFYFFEYLDRDDGMIRNDAPPRNIQYSAAQSLVNGLKKGTLKLLGEAEFKSFKTKFPDAREDLLRTDKELKRIIEESS